MNDSRGDGRQHLLDHKFICRRQIVLLVQSAAKPKVEAFFQDSTLAKLDILKEIQCERKDMHI